MGSEIESGEGDRHLRNPHPFIQSFKPVLDDVDSRGLYGSVSHGDGDPRCCNTPKRSPFAVTSLFRMKPAARSAPTFAWRNNGTELLHTRVGSVLIAIA